MTNPFILYDRGYKSMTEEINGIFIRNNVKPKIHIYELYHECVRKFEYLFIQYKINMLKLLKYKRLFENDTLPEEEMSNTHNLNKTILKQKEQLDRWLNEIIWLYNKINDVDVYPECNNCICEGRNIDGKWKIGINYKSI